MKNTLKGARSWAGHMAARPFYPVLKLWFGETVQALADEWLGKAFARGVPKTRENARRRFETYVYPVIGHKPVGLVSTKDISAILEDYERFAPNSTRKLYQHLYRFFEYADAKSRRSVENPVKPCIRLLLSSPEHGSFGFVQPRDMPDFLSKIKKRKMHKTTRAALMLMVYTGVRSRECLEARWPEFDLDKGVWHIPAGRMKARREHVVPLAPQVVALLRPLKRRAGSERVFCTTAPAVRYHVKAAGGHDATIHGFRKTFSTHAHESGLWSVDAIEMSLAHSVRGVRGVYNRAEYMNERRRLMNWYADQVDAWASGRIGYNPPVSTGQGTDDVPRLCIEAAAGRERSAA